MPCAICNSRHPSKVCGFACDGELCCQKRCHEMCARCTQQALVAVSESPLAPSRVMTLQCQREPSDQSGASSSDDPQPCPKLVEDRNAAIAAYAALNVTQHSADSFALDILLGNFANLVQDGSTAALVPGDLGHASRCAACHAPPDSAAHWCVHPKELWSRRLPNNPRTIYELMLQVRAVIVPGTVALLAALTPEPRLIVEKRLAQMEYIATLAQVMETDLWKAPYVDGLLEHIIGLRCEGIPDKLPRLLSTSSTAKALAARKARNYDEDLEDYQVEQVMKQIEEDRAAEVGSYLLYDDDSTVDAVFGNLRGENSLVKLVSTYMDGVGGAARYINRWMTQQGEDSWTQSSMGIKYFFADQRTVDKNVYYWGAHKHTDQNGCLQLQTSHCINEAGSLSILRKSFFVWHAFTIEILDKVEFPNRNHGNRTVKLIRTDGLNEIATAGFVKGTPKVAPAGFRGACESSSLTKAVTVFNSAWTTQDVPYHRIVGVYFTTRPGETTQCAFKADSENEFVFLPEGLTVLFTDPPRPPVRTSFW